MSGDQLRAHRQAIIDWGSKAHSISIERVELGGITMVVWSEVLILLGKYESFS